MDCFLEEGRTILFVIWSAFGTDSGFGSGLELAQVGRCTCFGFRLSDQGWSLGCGLVGYKTLVWSCARGWSLGWGLV